MAAITPQRAGKTTLPRIISGVGVRLYGRGVIEGLPQRACLKARLGYLPQQEQFDMQIPELWRRRVEGRLRRGAFPRLSAEDRKESLPCERVWLAGAGKN